MSKNEKPARPAEKIKAIMKAPSVEEQFKNVLKENAEPFVASIIDLYNGDQYLQQCEPKQVVMEALKAATLKMPINKALGFAYIVPYKGKAVMQIGYRGYIQLALRTGQYRIINTDVVYEGEVESINKLTGEISFTGERKSDKVVGYFAHIEMVNGFSKTLFMKKEHVVEHAKKYSKSYGYKDGAWQTEFDAMAKKTVIRNLLSHYGYLSVEMIGAISDDIKADREQRDEDVNEKTASKNIEEYATYEEVEEKVDEEVDPGLKVDPGPSTQGVSMEGGSQSSIDGPGF